MNVSIGAGYLVLALCLMVDAFVAPVVSKSKLRLHEGSDSLDRGEVEDFLVSNYPGLMELLDKNEAVWKKLKGSDEGFTLFAPTETAFENLGQKKLMQLRDPRNGEVKEKIGAYHAIPEQVTEEQLLNSGGVDTLGGDIESSVTSGGLFGFLGGGDDSQKTMTFNGAKVIKSMEVGAAIVHEVDGLVSPKILWRYADQLRIPGSQ